MVVFAIHRHESPTGTHVSPPSWTPSHLPPHHPSALSQSTGFGCPASCIDLALVIYFTYGNVYPNIFLIDLIFESSILEKKWSLVTSFVDMLIDPLVIITSEHFWVVYKPTQRVMTFIVGRHRLETPSIHSRPVNTPFALGSFGQCCFTHCT